VVSGDGDRIIEIFRDTSHGHFGVRDHTTAELLSHALERASARCARDAAGRDRRVTDAEPPSLARADARLTTLGSGA
jgi:hypothetical protein